MSFVPVDGMDKNRTVLQMETVPPLISLARIRDTIQND